MTSRVLLLVVVLTLASIFVAPAFGAVSWHGPDAHSSRPHRGIDSPLSADDVVSRLVRPLCTPSAGVHVLLEPLPLATRLAADSAFHPPE